MTTMDIARALTDDQLAHLLHEHYTIRGVVNHLTNGKPHEKLRAYISARARSLGWCRTPNIARKYTKQDVIKAFSVAGCWSDIYRSLGVSVCDHNKAGITTFAGYHGIEIPVFTKDDLVRAYQRGKDNWTREEIFCEHSTYSRANIRKAVIKYQILPHYECSMCGQAPTWNGRSLTLELDHTNGISTDNRPNNLRWLCPNCHTQTGTFKGKNTTKKSNS